MHAARAGGAPTVVFLADPARDKRWLGRSPRADLAIGGRDTPSWVLLRARVFQAPTR